MPRSELKLLVQRIVAGVTPAAYLTRRSAAHVAPVVPRLRMHASAARNLATMPLGGRKADEADEIDRLSCRS